jgi:hypothetical protein
MVNHHIPVVLTASRCAKNCTGFSLALALAHIGLLLVSAWVFARRAFAVGQLRSKEILLPKNLKTSNKIIFSPKVSLGEKIILFSRKKFVWTTKQFCFVVKSLSGRQNSFIFSPGVSLGDKIILFSRKKFVWTRKQFCFVVKSLSGRQNSFIFSPGVSLGDKIILFSRKKFVWATKQFCFVVKSLSGRENSFIFSSTTTHHSLFAIHYSLFTLSHS